VLLLVVVVVLRKVHACPCENWDRNLVLLVIKVSFFCLGTLEALGRCLVSVARRSKILVSPGERS